jgi:hypothetical protein
MNEIACSPTEMIHTGTGCIRRGASLLTVEGFVILLGSLRQGIDGTLPDLVPTNCN